MSVICCFYECSLNFNVRTRERKKAKEKESSVRRKSDKIEEDSGDSSRSKMICVIVIVHAIARKFYSEGKNNRARISHLSNKKNIFCLCSSFVILFCQLGLFNSFIAMCIARSFLSLPRSNTFVLAWSLPLPFFFYAYSLLFMLHFELWHKKILYNALLLPHFNYCANPHLCCKNISKHYKIYSIEQYETDSGIRFWNKNSIYAKNSNWLKKLSCENQFQVMYILLNITCDLSPFLC